MTNDTMRFDILPLGGVVKISYAYTRLCVVASWGCERVESMQERSAPRWNGRSNWS